MLHSSYAVAAKATTSEGYISLLLQTIPLAILINPIMGIAQCFGEEFAWRGYLLPKLSTKFTPIAATILTSIIWGIWHAPFIVMGYNYGTEHPLLGVLAMIVLCVVLGIISGFLFFRSKSIWPAVLFHAAINGMDLYAPSDLFMEKEANPFIGPDLIGLIGGIGFILIALLCLITMKNRNKSSKPA